MEATKEGTGKLLHTILPPRLEDCALPPYSITEAFFKAASAVKSRATSFFHEDDESDEPGHCVDDPWPRAKDSADTVVGVGGFADAPGPCGAVNGGGVVEEGADKVMVLGGGDKVEEGERVVVPGAEVADGGGCVEGEREKHGDKEEENKDGESEKPRLVEGFAWDL